MRFVSRMALTILVFPAVWYGWMLWGSLMGSLSRNFLFLVMMGAVSIFFAGVCAVRALWRAQLKGEVQSWVIPTTLCMLVFGTALHIDLSLYHERVVKEWTALPQSGRLAAWQTAWRYDQDKPVNLKIEPALNKPPLRPPTVDKGYFNKEMLQEAFRQPSVPLEVSPEFYTELLRPALMNVRVAVKPFRDEDRSDPLVRQAVNRLRSVFTAHDATLVGENEASELVVTIRYCKDGYLDVMVWRNQENCVYQDLVTPEEIPQLFEGFAVWYGAERALS